MKTEIWKDVVGFEGRYQVSNLGRVKSLAFSQRCLVHGFERYRQTAERILAQQFINSGYLLVHLHLDNKRTAKTVHRMVAMAFVPGHGTVVNHLDGDRTNNTPANLEWTDHRGNNRHTVASGRNKLAKRVVHPQTGEVYGSINHAARASGVGAKVIRRNWAAA